MAAFYARLLSQTRTHVAIGRTVFDALIGQFLYVYLTDVHFRYLGCICYRFGGTIQLLEEFFVLIFT